MKIKHLILTLAAIAFIALASINVSVNAQEAKDGKTVFTEQKCDMCHSINSLGIASKKKSGAIDLSNAAVEGDAEFFAKYLKKETDLKGKKHPAQFKGSDEDLTILTEWLTTLKSE
ncbi:MAG TPA: c-type cytochrome [Candidatus Kapabacteria bacterium]|jgi:cytochrome c5|nr:c-type cytochrome [Candidatus Kapabacteria bacterium]HOM05317.1 c-type cytochrome [Candidatus Kapabacteria bacterium]